MRELYPEITRVKKYSLKVSSLHTLYVEECGNPKGIPALFLHGGPGAGISPNHRRFFNPEKYRIILFDQRGAGKSKPYAELAENTIWDLIADIELIRLKLKVSKWLVFGGSWGSTLALAYAISHPERILHLIVRGIFLCRHEEILWFYQYGAHQIFPDHWKDYVKVIPENERHDMLSAFYRRLTSPDKKVRLEAARAWSLWEGATICLEPNKAMHHEFGEIAVSLARIECHYFMHNCFFPDDNYLLNNAHKLQNISAEIIHGRYDIVCPVKNAFDLKEKMPRARLTIVPASGHAAFEPGIRSALIEATDRFRKK
ncbi:prolyl aminopeptidase [Turneriella parva]|uniref:Proline iminopeptidase n=1 Tax=Turneriella parva (strain ATCC BAA-1111 / DSM 21527 / NCTC 11395 / H) TaxID=869212 RepID=I4B837_TURPD|nr:prolyl aminopeptidase [Turneriella parva]AFM13444.1 prolyl aminopeptidase [Turneriella parva DSM 21527]